jgi:hypothetical protein
MRLDICIEREDYKVKIVWLEKGTLINLKFIAQSSRELSSLFLIFILNKLSRYYFDSFECKTLKNEEARSTWRDNSEKTFTTIIPSDCEMVPRWGWIKN